MNSLQYLSLARKEEIAVDHCCQFMQGDSCGLLLLFLGGHLEEHKTSHTRKNRTKKRY